MRLRYPYTPARGYVQLVSPATHPIERLDFGMLSLPAGGAHALASGEHELGLVILTGTCDITVDGAQHTGLGGRASVFDGRATGVYVPRDAQVEVHSTSDDLEVAVCRARTDARYPARVVRPEDVRAREVGEPGFRRYVHDVFGPEMPAGRLIVGETYTIEGNWSSYPPHKHDVEAPPDEVKQEELYLFKIRPADGFGIQFFYTPPGSPYAPLDEAQPVRENDITLIPYGYHPVAAPPGYDVYYLWFLSGDSHVMRPRDDPAHAWVRAPGAAREGQRAYPK
jgi:5-deoxy-glucuronate isomerase